MFSIFVSVSVTAQIVDTAVHFDGNFSNQKINVRIDSIQITGNKITNPEVILRELTFGIGDTVNEKILKYNRERIYSLNIFTLVDLNIKKKNNLNVLVIQVRESWYIYPIPFIELEDQDWEKISYGVSLFIRNFQGWNETIWAVSSLGYDPKVQLFYNHPYLFQKNKIDFSWQLFYQKIQNKSKYAEDLYGSNFYQKHLSASLGFTKRFDLFNNLNFTLGYDYIANPFYIKGVSASNGMIDRAPLFGLYYTHDTRDLIQFPENGLFVNAGIQLKGMGIDGINYQIANLDFREYKTFFSELRAKWRFTTRMTFGTLVPFYDYSFIGYDERIRGNFFLEMEGRNSYLTSIEFNYPIIKDVYVSLNFIPFLPKELLQYRFGIYLELYTDAGAVTETAQHLKFNDFRSGYGTGLTFLFLPYTILRTEFAFNEYKKSEVIIAIGTSF